MSSLSTSNFERWKLLGFLAKRVTGVNVPGIFFIKDRPICSYLAAWCNEAARDRSLLWPGFGMAPQAADPDEMMDFCLANPEFWKEAESVG